MPHIITLGDKRILLSVDKEEYEKKKDYIDNELVFFISTKNLQEGAFGFEFVEKEKPSKVHPILWEIIMSKDDISENINKIIETLTFESLHTKDATPIKKVIDLLNEAKETIENSSKN